MALFINNFTETVAFLNCVLSHEEVYALHSYNKIETDKMAM